MLSLANRLKKKKDFDNVFKKGEGFKEKSLFLKMVKNHLKTSRFGFVVAKAVARKATRRNLIKRRLRELIHKYLPRIKPGYDIVLVAQKGIETQEFSETEEMMSKILVKTKLLC